MRPALDLDQDPLEPSPFRGQHVLNPHRSLRIHMLMAIILVKRRMQKVAFMDQKGGWEFEFALMVAARHLTRADGLSREVDAHPCRALTS